MGRGREWMIVGAATLTGAGFPDEALAGVATITADRDNTLYQDATGSLSSGAGDAFFAGVTGSGSKRRGLVHFDVSALPSNAVVNSASVGMFSTRALNTSAVHLHRATQDWGQGTSDAGPTGGGGAAATEGDATWLHTFYEAAFWANAGGDFAETASASSSAGNFASFSFGVTSQLNADVQGWINNGATNFGWAVLGNESVNGSAKRIASSEYADANLRPKLTVDYSTSTWKSGAGGAWSASGNWDFGVPDGIGAEANFSFAGPLAVVIAVNVDGPRTVGTINFTTASAYALSGSQLTLDRAVGRNAINVTNGGAHAISADVHLNRTTDIDVSAGGALNVSGDLTTAAGVGIIKKSGGTLTAKNVRAASLTINAGAVTIAPNGGNAGTSRVESLVIVQGKLNVNDNDFIVDYGPTDASPEVALRNHVKAFVDNPSAATGISYTRGSGDRVVAIAAKTEWGKSEFNGFALDDTTVIGKYTYYGDANLDGKVDSNDYVAVDVGLGNGDSWVQGDFNFSGSVTSDDYVAIDTNLGKGITIGDPLAIAELKAEMIALHTTMFGDVYLEKLAIAEAHGFAATFVPEPGWGAGGVIVSLGALRRLRIRGRRGAG